MAINQYKLGDRMYVENFLASQTGINVTTVLINVTSVSTTIPQLFSISYIAISNESSITVALLGYTSVPEPLLSLPTSQQEATIVHLPLIR